MNALVTKYADRVTGSLSGWDRLVFRGYFQMLATVGGLVTWLGRLGVALEDFAKHAQEYTNRLKTECLLAAELANRPYKYLNSSQERKEEVARRFFVEPLAAPDVLRYDVPLERVSNGMGYGHLLPVAGRLAGDLSASGSRSDHSVLRSRYLAIRQDLWVKRVV